MRPLVQRRRRGRPAARGETPSNERHEARRPFPQGRGSGPPSASSPEHLRPVTDKRLEELDNWTEKVADIVSATTSRTGWSCSRPCTRRSRCSWNQWQSALLQDVKSMLDKVVSPKDGVKHNHPAFWIATGRTPIRTCRRHCSATRSRSRWRRAAGARTVPVDHRRGARRAAPPGSRRSDHRQPSRPSAWTRRSPVIPLFPLPNVVLFPHMSLPLHVFEPRYRKMVL